MTTHRRALRPKTKTTADSLSLDEMVYVGKEEFESRREEIQRRFRELHFPSESLRSLESEQDSSHVLVGLYARGKLQRDAWQSAYRITKPV